MSKIGKLFYAQLTTKLERTSFLFRDSMKLKEVKLAKAKRDHWRKKFYHMNH